MLSFLPFCFCSYDEADGGARDGDWGCWEAASKALGRPRFVKLMSGGFVPAFLLVFGCVFACLVSLPRALSLFFSSNAGLAGTGVCRLFEAAVVVGGGALQWVSVWVWVLINLCLCFDVRLCFWFGWDLVFLLVCCLLLDRILSPRKNQGCLGV